MKKYKYFLLCILTCIFLFFSSNNTYAADTSSLEINSPSVILIERNTGNILYEKK